MEKKIIIIQNLNQSPSQRINLIITIKILISLIKKLKEILHYQLKKKIKNQIIQIETKTRKKKKKMKME
jgi:hypothetical protein